MLIRKPKNLATPNCILFAHATCYFVGALTFTCGLGSIGLFCPHSRDFPSMRRNSSHFGDCDHRLGDHKQKRNRKPYSASRTLRQGRVRPKKAIYQPRTSGRVAIICWLHLPWSQCWFGHYITDCLRTSRRSGESPNCCLMDQISVRAVRSGRSGRTVHGEAYPDLGVGVVYACLPSH